MTNPVPQLETNLTNAVVKHVLKDRSLYHFLDTLKDYVAYDVLADALKDYLRYRVERSLPRHEPAAFANSLTKITLNEIDMVDVLNLVFAIQVPLKEPENEA